MSGIGEVAEPQGLPSRRSAGKSTRSLLVAQTARRRHARPCAEHLLPLTLCCNVNGLNQSQQTLGTSPRVTIERRKTKKPEASQPPAYRHSA
jgi:hypothetical protein